MVDCVHDKKDRPGPKEGHSWTQREKAGDVQLPEDRLGLWARLEFQSRGPPSAFTAQGMSG